MIILPFYGHSSTDTSYAQVTYSDLPDGYDAVATEVELAPRVVNGEIAYAVQGWLAVLDDPESVAVLLVWLGCLRYHALLTPFCGQARRIPGAADGDYTTCGVITHRKLRFLLKDAIDCEFLVYICILLMLTTFRVSHATWN